jgi:hypothetical protein
MVLCDSVQLSDLVFQITSPPPRRNIGFVHTAVLNCGDEVRCGRVTVGALLNKATMKVSGNWTLS